MALEQTQVFRISLRAELSVQRRVIQAGNIRELWPEEDEWSVICKGGVGRGRQWWFQEELCVPCHQAPDCAVIMYLLPVLSSSVLTFS